MPAASVGDERLEDPLAHGRDRRGIGPGERDDRPPVTGRTPLALHPVDVDADIRGEICLVDDEQVGAGDARPTLADDVPSPGDVEHEDLRVDERGRERRGEVVPAGLDEHKIQGREILLEVLDREEVHRHVVADRRVRAGAGLDGPDSRGVEHPGGAQHPGVLVGVDVVRHDAEGQLITEFAAQHPDERGLAGAHRPGDTET